MEVIRTRLPVILPDGSVWLLSVYTHSPHFQVKRKGEKWRRRWVSGFKALCRRISKFSEFGIISYHLSLELILKLVIHFYNLYTFQAEEEQDGECESSQP